MKGGTRKKGSKWYYYFDVATIEGKRKRIERAGGDTQKEAQKRLRAALTEYETSGDYKNNTSLSFSDFLDLWLKQYVKTQCKLTTYELYSDYINRHIKPELGCYKLTSLKIVTLQDFLNRKSLNGYSKNTISNFYGILSGAFKYSVYPMQYLKENPMIYVKMPRFKDTVENYTRDKLKIITLENFNSIINRFPEHSNFYIPLQIAFNTGLRVGEVCALEWEDVNFVDSTLTVNKTQIIVNNHYTIGTPKTQSSYRTIRIGESLIKILKNHKIHQEEMRKKYGQYYVNTNNICTKENGEPLTTGSMKYLSRVVNYELKIPFNFHSLRHTHATMLLSAGANMKDVQKRLGHSKLSTTMDTYAHVTEKMKTETVDILESIINKNSTIKNS